MTETLLRASAAWWQWIAPLSAQGAVLILLVALVDRLLPRRTWPQLRAALWLLALGRLLLPPTLETPNLELPWNPDATVADLLATPWWSQSVLDGLRPGNWALAVVTIWVAGLVLLATLGAVRYLRLRRALDRLPEAPEPEWLALEAQRAAHDLGLKRLPRLRLSPEVSSPFVTGLWRPHIYLPADLRRGDAHHVLLHELAHVQRRDLWLAAGACLVPLLYWFHPLVWWAKRRIDVLREQCCDRTVARVLGGDVQPYRRTLARLACSRTPLSSSNALAGSLAGQVSILGFARRRSQLLVRLEALQHAERESRLLRRGATALALALGLTTAAALAQPATRASHAVAEWIERPPGCLPLRFMVFKRLAEERALTPSEETSREEK